MTAGAGTVVVAFMLGAVTGAAVALLMAPASGEETRRMLAEGPRRPRACRRSGPPGARTVEPPARHPASAFERGREAYEQARSTPPVKPAGEGV